MDAKLKNSYQMENDVIELEERFKTLMSKRQKDIFDKLVVLRVALEAFDNGQLTEEGIGEFENTLVLVRKALPADPDLFKLIRRGRWLKIFGIVLLVTSVSWLLSTSASLFIVISALLGHGDNTHMIPELLVQAVGALGIYYLWNMWLRARRL